MTFNPANVKSRSSALRTGEIYSGGGILGMLPYTGFICRVTAVDTAKTVIRIEILRSLGNDMGTQSLDDMFNAGFKLKTIKGGTGPGTNNGEIVDITNFDSDLGQLTTVAVTADYLVGDIVALIPDEISQLASTATPKGEVFYVTKTLTKASVIHTGSGVAITAASTGGAVAIEGITIQNDTNVGADASGGIQVITNDVIAMKRGLIANGAALTSFASIQESIGHILNTGKIIYLQALTDSLTGDDNIQVTLKLRRLAQDATLAAAA